MAEQLPFENEELVTDDLYDATGALSTKGREAVGFVEEKLEGVQTVLGSLEAHRVGLEIASTLAMVEQPLREQQIIFHEAAKAVSESNPNLRFNPSADSIGKVLKQVATTKDLDTAVAVDKAFWRGINKEDAPADESLSAEDIATNARQLADEAGQRANTTSDLIIDTARTYAATNQQEKVA